MAFLRKLLREAHRRSLWQILGIYLGGSWAVLQAVDFMTDFAGLPEWTPTMAFVLLLIGLPVTAATAFVQEGVPGMRPEPAHDEGEVDLLTPDDVEQRPPEHDRQGADVFTWRNALLGGVGAALLLGLSVTAYFVLWGLGIGPMGSLVAQGVLDERDPVLLAAFENRTADESLGAVVTDALRVDLLESQVVTLVDDGLVGEVLQRMGRSGASLTPEVAREVAVREGIKAVVEGQVSRAGSGYLLSARLVDPRDGAAFAAFRETAADDGEILPAIDRLSEQLRAKAGESLRDIRAGEPLEAVTTSSLEALRLFVRAVEAEAAGEYERTFALLEEAVALDSTFAMAWRKLAVAHSNRGNDQAAQIAAASAAYRHRSRLTTRERNLTEAYYHYTVTGDQEATAEAYRRVLDDHPHDPAALNNLGIYYGERNEWAEAAELYQRAVSGPGRSTSAFNNLVLARYNEGRKEEALSVLGEWEERYPYEWRMARHRITLLWGMGDPAAAEAFAREAMERLSDDAFGVRDLQRRLSDLLEAQGRLAEARELILQARALAQREGDHRGVFFADRELSWLDLMTAPTRSDSLAVLRRLERQFDAAMVDVPEVNRPYGGMGFGWIVVAEDPERARHWWDRADAATPESRRQSAGYRQGQLFDRGMVHFARGEPAQALEVFRDLLRQIGSCPTCYRRQLARAHAELGRPDSAVVHLEAFLEGDTFDFFDDRELQAWEVLPELARLYEEAGRPEDAAATWTRFADRWQAADDALQPQVRRARAEAERLTGGPASP